MTLSLLSLSRSLALPLSGRSLALVLCVLVHRKCPEFGLKLTRMCMGTRCRYAGSTPATHSIRLKSPSATPMRRTPTTPRGSEQGAAAAVSPGELGAALRSRYPQMIPHGRGRVVCAPESPLRFWRGAFSITSTKWRACFRTTRSTGKGDTFSFGSARQHQS